MMFVFSTHRSVGALELEKRTDEEGVSQPFLSGAGFVKHFMEIWYVLLIYMLGEGKKSAPLNKEVLRPCCLGFKFVKYNGNMMWKKCSLLSAFCLYMLIDEGQGEENL